MTRTANRHLTFAHNMGMRRHGLLRLTPAYSVRLVEELLDAHGGRPRALLDPFCGTATTALAGGQRGIPSQTLDINPFLIWLGQAKTRNYDQAYLHAAGAAAQAVLDGAYAEEGLEGAWRPPIFNIDRWWHPGAQLVLSRIHGVIGEQGAEQVADVLKLAMCRTVISTSAAAFNHQSMSFKDEVDRRPFDLAARQAVAQFAEDLGTVLDALADPVEVVPEIILGDSREVPRHVAGPVDLVITSPPYPNRMTYIRELRPYMYWLGFLVESEEAAELDWQAIGGTWGSATSMVGRWRPEREVFVPGHLREVVDAIAASGEKSAQVLSRYVEKYFYDTWLHLQGQAEVLDDEYAVHYVVGNSTYYGTLLNVEQVYAEMMRELGLANVEVHNIRARSSKKQLYEFRVSARS